MTNKADQFQNALTFDVEDYYQVSAFEKHIDRNAWMNYESRVKNNTGKILSLLDTHKIKATFFVLGKVAEENKGLVSEIYSQGHEIACHGYSHKLVYNQTHDEFKYETEKSKDLLESETGIKVRGYRAASYSITRKSLWALDILEKCGFQYDSSIFPIYHDRYGIEDFDKKIQRINYMDKTYNLVEFPISATRIAGVNIPVSGGGYFRLYPYFLTRFFLRHFLRSEKIPFMFYLHPWELDPDQPRIDGISAFTKFRHYNNLEKCKDRLENLVSDFSFSRVDSILENMNLLNRSS